MNKKIILILAVCSIFCGLSGQKKLSSIDTLEEQFKNIQIQSALDEQIKMIDRLLLFAHKDLANLEKEWLETEQRVVEAMNQADVRDVIKRTTITECQAQQEAIETEIEQVEELIYNLKKNKETLLNPELLEEFLPEEPPAIEEPQATEEPKTLSEEELEEYQQVVEKTQIVRSRREEEKLKQLARCLPERDQCQQEVVCRPQPHATIPERTIHTCQKDTKIRYDRVPEPDPSPSQRNLKPGSSRTRTLYPRQLTRCEKNKIPGVFRGV